MEDNRERELRMAALCRRLGHLWNGRKVAVLDNVVTEAKLQECERTVFGKLHGSPSVNFLAFQATMKKAWKTNSIICKHLQPGLFSFEFESVQERNRILNSGPWSFSSHLLVI